MIIKLCITGNNFSGIFLDCLVRTIEYARKKNWTLQVHRSEGNNSYYVKNDVLRGCFTKGQYQLPFDGEDYDYIIWLDSDIVWNPKQIEELIETEGEIVTGLYIMTGNKNYFPCIENLDIEYAKIHKHYKYLHRDELTNDIKIVDVGCMGFMKVKKGVFEDIPYPWFYPELSADYGFMTGDITFFLKAKEEGFEVKVNQSIIVGHEKKTILI